MLPYISSGSTVAAAAGHIAPQRHLANRHALRISGSVSYALLFLYESETTPCSREHAISRSEQRHI